MINYLETLDNIFSRLIDDIGYIYVDSKHKLRIVQKNEKLRIRNIYFDIKDGEFIKYTTIQNNKQVIKKLQEYQSQGQLICYIPIEEGFLVRVYNRYGELLYRQYIKFFDKVSRFTKWYLKKRYPQLALDD